MDEGNYESRFLQLEARILKLEERLALDFEAPFSAPAKRISAKEFLLTKNVRAETQKLLALSYFIERSEGLASFNVSDIEAAFRSAREKVPKNINDAVNKNVARGFLMEAKEKKDAKKAWLLTSTGERFVENELS